MVGFGKLVKLPGEPLSVESPSKVHHVVCPYFLMSVGAASVGTPSVS